MPDEVFETHFAQGYDGSKKAKEENIRKDKQKDGLLSEELKTLTKNKK